MTLTVMNAIVAITWRSLKSPEFFRLLHAIAKIAFITVRIIVSLDYICAVQYNYDPFHNNIIVKGSPSTDRHCVL